MTSRGLARSATTTFLVRVYGAGLIFATHLFLADAVGVEQYGVYAFAWTWLISIAFLAPLGYDTGLIRFLSSYRTTREWGRARGALRAGHVTTIVTATAAAGLGAAGLWLSDPDHSSPYTGALLAAAVFLPAVALINLHEGIARGMKWVALVAVPSFALRPTLFLTIAAVAIYGFGADRGQQMVLAFGSACAVTFAVQWAGFRHQLPPEIRQAVPEGASHEWLRVSLPIVFVASFELMLCNTDVVMTGLLLGPEQTGVYSVAVRTAMSLSFVFFAVSAYAGPRMSELFTEGDRDELVAFTRQMRLWTFVPTLLLALTLAAVGPFVLRLFDDPAFQSAYWPMVVLSGVALLRAAVGPIDSLLIMTGRERNLAAVLGTAAIINLILNAVLIPFLGLWGAASATVASVFVELTILTMLVDRHLGFSPFRTRTPPRGASS